MDTGTIFRVFPNGCYLCERDGDSIVLFVHPKHIASQRRLHIDDRISFNSAPSSVCPGKLQANDVTYLGHTIARQVSDNGSAR